MDLNLLVARDTVQTMLTSFIDGVELQTDGALRFIFNEALLFAHIFPTGEEQSAVVVQAFARTDLRPDAELFRYIATRSPLFCPVYALQQDNGMFAVLCRAALLGNDIDESELYMALHGVAETVLEVVEGLNLLSF